MPSRLIEIRDAAYRWPASGFGLRIGALDMASGESLLLIGPSGSGKSTLLALVAGIVAPSEGRLAILGTDLRRLSASGRDAFRAEHMGVVFQMFNLLPYGTALDNVLLGLSFAPARRKRPGTSAEARAEALRLLASLGLDAELVAGRRASDLSVGQQQRVAVARALIGQPELIIADEPTSALDTDTRDRFLDLAFAELRASGAGLLMVSHDPSLGPRFDRVVRLADIITQSAGQPGRADGARP